MRSNRFRRNLVLPLLWMVMMSPASRAASIDTATIKESDAIGHPIVSVNDWLTEPLELLCPSETLSFFPYLLSTLDLTAWRFGIPELVYPQSLIPGLREIGRWPLNTWGAVYPRHGFVTQAEDPKAGAVVAQRAGDVVTRTGQPHVYRSTVSTRPSASDWHVWWPGPLREMNRHSGHWQMLVPRPSRSCEVFGRNDTLSCEQMEAEIAQGKNPFREWITLAKGNDWKVSMGVGGDIVEAKRRVEDNNGRNGVP